MPSPVLISTPSNLHHSMLVSPLPHLMPWEKSGYTLQYFVSFPRTATNYVLQMEPSTTIPGATSGNTVSSALMLSLRPHQPHWNRLTPGFQDLCHSLPQHSPNTTISCTCDPRTKPCCPRFYTYSHANGHPSVYTHLYTKCSTCATMTVKPCHTAQKHLITEM